jgi:hypothetical protein
MTTGTTTFQPPAALALQWNNPLEREQLAKTSRHVIIDLITLLRIYLLGNLHISHIFGWIRLSQGKEIHPIP